MTRSRGLLLLTLAAITAAFAAFVALTGGIDTRIFSIPVRSRSWERPATIAALFALMGLFAFRREVVSAAAVLKAPVLAGARRVACVVPGLAVCWAGVAALAFGTFAAGGADSYGYISQAELLAHGRLVDVIPNDPAYSWPDVPGTLTPLGYTQGTTRLVLAPVYPPGLPLLMAPFAAINSRAVFLIVPLCAAAAVFFCLVLGRELGEPLVAACAACLLAVSPTFLYQAVQPMSDVPVTASWLGALVLARRPTFWGAPAAGVLASIAILVRPNLAPLAFFVVAAATIADRIEWRRGLACALAMLPGVVALAAIQSIRYGAPLGSGYGTFDDLFSMGNIAPNLARYPRWLTETHTPFIWTWLAAPIWILRMTGRMPYLARRTRHAAPSTQHPASVRRFAWICYAWSFAVIAAYLPYMYFRPDEWFYTRFLLPALPLMLLLGVAVTLDVARRVVPRASGIATGVVTFALAVLFISTAERVGTFGLHGAEEKYPAVGAFVREQLPPAAFVFAMQHSGSIRYYSGCYTLRWDRLDRAALDQTITALRAAGHEPFAALDPDEEIEFRKRFESTGQQSVERMAPVATIGPTRVFAFR